MMVNPSCHINFGKNGEILALPYPVAPPGDRRAFNFCSVGRAKSLLASSSTSSMTPKGMPWFFNWKAPHFSHAWPMRSIALGSMRSMMGMDDDDDDDDASSLG